MKKRRKEKSGKKKRRKKKRKKKIDCVKERELAFYRRFIIKIHMFIV